MISIVVYNGNDGRRNTKMINDIFAGIPAESVVFVFEFVRDAMVEETTEYFTLRELFANHSPLRAEEVFTDGAMVDKLYRLMRMSRDLEADLRRASKMLSRSCGRTCPYRIDTPHLISQHCGKWCKASSCTVRGAHTHDRNHLPIQAEVWSLRPSQLVLAIENPEEPEKYVNNTVFIDCVRQHHRNEMLLQEEAAAEAVNDCSADEFLFRIGIEVEATKAFAKIQLQLEEAWETQPALDVTENPVALIEEIRREKAKLHLYKGKDYYLKKVYISACEFYLSKWDSEYVEAAQQKQQKKQGRDKSQSTFSLQTFRSAAPR